MDRLADSYIGTRAVGFCSSFFTFFWETPRFKLDSVSLREKSGLEKKRREVICRRDHRKNGCFSVQKSLDRIWKFPPFSSSPSTFWHHLSQDFLEEIIFEDNLDEKVSVRFWETTKGAFLSRRGFEGKKHTQHKITHWESRNHPFITQTHKTK